MKLSVLSAEGTVLAMAGGIGEHAPLIRSRVAAQLAFLGVDIDEEANGRVDDDADISSAGARVVDLTAREDLEIRRQTRIVLAAGRTVSSSGYAASGTR